jgi:hypothetical protein
VSVFREDVQLLASDWRDVHHADSTPACDQLPVIASRSIAEYAAPLYNSTLPFVVMASTSPANVTVFTTSAAIRRPALARVPAEPSAVVTADTRRGAAARLLPLESGDSGRDPEREIPEAIQPTRQVGRGAALGLVNHDLPAD